MTPTGPSNPNPAIDESDLLALVEGTPLPAERAALVREALAADPSLAELAALMRADRDAVASLPQVHAPADLLDRVEALLERDALVGLAHTEAAATAEDLPVSAVIPARKPWLTLRTGAPLAAAAAVLLIAGGVLMLPAKQPKHLPKPGPAEPNNGIDVANNNTVPPAPADNVTPPKAVDIAAATKTNDPTPTIDDGPMGPPAPVSAMAATIEPQRLMELASQGRLVLRLSAPADRAVNRVRALQAGARTLHVEPMSEGQRSAAAQVFVASWSRRHQPIEIIKPTVHPEPGPLASENPPTSHPGPTVANQTEPPAHRDPDPVLSSEGYIATVPATAEALEALRAALDNKTVPADWQILDEPLSLEAPADASTVLWWTAPPSAWARRWNVPIIVQTN